MAEKTERKSEEYCENLMEEIEYTKREKRLLTDNIAATEAVLKQRRERLDTVSSKLTGLMTEMEERDGRKDD